jgi:hypothetical protein
LSTTLNRPHQAWSNKGLVSAGATSSPTVRKVGWFWLSLWCGVLFGSFYCARWRKLARLGFVLVWCLLGSFRSASLGSFFVCWRGLSQRGLYLGWCRFGSFFVCWRGLSQRGLYLGWCRFGSFSSAVEGIGCRFWIFISLFWIFFLVRRREPGSLSRLVSFWIFLSCGGGNRMPILDLHLSFLDLLSSAEGGIGC